MSVPSLPNDAVEGVENITAIHELATVSANLEPPNVGSGQAQNVCPRKR